MVGSQLWLNLPAENKMVAPSYCDIPNNAIPELHPSSGVRVRIIAGHSGGIKGAVNRPDTEPIFLDLHLPAGSQFAQPLPAGHNAFLYTYRGEISVQGIAVPDRFMAILANDSSNGVLIKATQAARVILVAGKPLKEPIAQYGPFVMNTHDEVEQALRDYKDGLFEKAVIRAR